MRAIGAMSFAIVIACGGPGTKAAATDHKHKGSEAARHAAERAEHERKKQMEEAARRAEHERKHMEEAARKAEHERAKQMMEAARKAEHEAKKPREEAARKAEHAGKQHTTAATNAEHEGKAHHQPATNAEHEKKQKAESEARIAARRKERAKQPARKHVQTARDREIAGILSKAAVNLHRADHDYDWQRHEAVDLVLNALHDLNEPEPNLSTHYGGMTQKQSDQILRENIPILEQAKSELSAGGAPANHRAARVKIEEALSNLHAALRIH